MVLEASVQSLVGSLEAPCSPPLSGCGGVGEVLAVAKEVVVTEWRKRGRPRKIPATGKQLALGYSIEEVVEVPRVEV